MISAKKSEGSGDTATLHASILASKAGASQLAQEWVL